jgi:hypothetical protein
MLSLGQIKTSRLPQRLGVCATDERFGAWVNEAQQRLLSLPANYWGTFTRILLCFPPGCRNFLVMPPGVVAVRGAYEPAGGTVELKNQWWEMLGPCAGCIPEGCGCCYRLTDAGQTPTYWQPGVPFRVKVQSNIADNGLEVRLRGVDPNGHVVRTSCEDGERLKLDSANPPLTVHSFGRLTGISKPQTCVTLRFLAVYFVPNTDGTEGWHTEEAPIQEAEVWEEQVWRRMYRLDANASSCQLEVIVKWGHRPVRADEDLFVLQNPSALSDMAEAVRAREERDFERATAMEASAMRLLNAELRNFTSDVSHVSWRAQPDGSMARVFSCFN